MRITVNLSRCQAYANCIAEAPTIFALDDSTGKVLVLNSAPNDHLLAEVERAESSCPVRAISIEY
jgi:ferredoxin